MILLLAFAAALPVMAVPAIAKPMRLPLPVTAQGRPPVPASKPIVIWQGWGMGIALAPTPSRQPALVTLGVQP